VEVEDREVNVLIKTARAAGLGEYKAGRRGYQTGLALSDEYETYAVDLAERYPLQFLRPLVPVSGLDPANLPMVNSVLSWL